MGAGEVTVDLTGDWQNDLDVNIEGGVGEITLRLPRGVGVRVEAEHVPSGKRRHTNSCYLTFVAIDESGRPRQVSPIVPQSDEEMRRHEAAKTRRALRRQAETG
jgi:hypothetical protein